MEKKSAFGRIVNEFRCTCCGRNLGTENHKNDNCDKCRRQELISSRRLHGTCV